MRKSTNTSNTILGYVNSWFLKSDFTYHILSLHLVGSRLHLRRIFGYLNNYPKRGYATNPRPLTIDSNYYKVQMNYDFVNQYAYFSEDIDEHFP